MEKPIKKHINPQELKSRVKELKDQGKKIVTLNGSFDLLHAGHLYILSEAKKRGDVLIVALNSDHSIQQYKGKNRPIIPLKYRMELIAALCMVDYVTWFDETDPRNILNLIKPDVHVNGREYQDHCIEKEVVEKNGGTLYFVDRIEGLSTTNILQKIQKCV